MRLALDLYFILMSFWLGREIREETDFTDWRNYIKLIFCPFIALVWIIYTVSTNLYTWLKNTFQLKFFWRHYILNRQYEKGTIDSWNNTLKFKNTKSIAHRIWRLCVRLATKRFNKQNNGNIH